MTRDPPSVLVVEDEADVADVYALALPDEYEIHTAHGGQEALEAIDESADVILLDREMPNVSGDEVLERLRARDIDAQVAMVTGVDPDFDIAEMDFDAYLTKPVDGDELRDVVEQLLALSYHSGQMRELFTIAVKKAALETEKSDAELAASEEYTALAERQSHLCDETTTRIATRGREFFRKSISTLQERQQ